MQPAAVSQGRPHRRIPNAVTVVLRACLTARIKIVGHGVHLENRDIRRQLRVERTRKHTRLEGERQRHGGHLPVHAEMEGKTLFFKYNTGPAGHGAPAALGEAVAAMFARDVRFAPYRMGSAFLRPS